MTTILITGGSSGIGYNLLQFLLSLGTFKIIYTYNSNVIIRWILQMKYNLIIL